MPRVSLLTPCYNAEAFIGRMIASARRQTYTDWEQIIVDDGSQDGSREIVIAETHQDVRIRLVAQPNAGVAAARNRAFRESSPTADYLLFFDADDLLEPDMLAQMVAYLDNHPDVGMVYCDPIFIDEHDQELSPKGMGWSPRYVPSGLGVRTLRDDEPETPFLSVLSLATIIPSLTLMRRSAYQKTPGWDEAFGHICEDSHLYLHMALVSRIHYLPRPLVRYRRHKGQSTASMERYARQEEKLLTYWRAPQGLTPAQMAIVRQAWIFREGRLLPYQGVNAGVRHLRQGELLLALRFLLGALRRYLKSLLQQTVPKSLLQKSLLYLWPFCWTISI